MNEASGGGSGMARGHISVFLLDDHEMVRRGVRDLLEAEPDIDVVGEAGTMASALEQMPRLRPDVAVLDVRLPDGDGVSDCREVRSTLPGTACLMLTAHGSDEALVGSILAGAAGYVSKHTWGSDLVDAVRTVAAGRSTLDANAEQQVMERLRRQLASVGPLAALTDSEKAVLELIGGGLTNPQVAAHMSVTEDAVKDHVSSLMGKLGMQRRTQAAAFAAQLAKNRND